jgi:Ca2+/Na+ antiporter
MRLPMPENITARNAPLLGVVGLAMVLGLGFTSWSLFKGLYIAVGVVLGAVAATLFLLLGLILLSHFAAKSLADRISIGGIFYLAVLVLFVLGLSFFSFSAWNNVVGERNGWFVPEAQSSVSAYYDFNREVVDRAEEAVDTHAAGFADEPAVTTYVAGMKQADSLFRDYFESADDGSFATKLRQASGDGLDAAREAKEDAEIALVGLGQTAAQANSRVGELEREIDAFPADIVDGLQARLKAAHDIETTNPNENGELRPGSSTLRDLKDPDAARIVLQDLDQASLGLQVDVDSCGPLALLDVREAEGYEPARRSWGSGGSCDAELKQHLDAIQSLKDRNAELQIDLISARSDAERANSALRETQAEVTNLEARITELNGTIENANDFSISLADKADALIQTPGDTTLNELVMECTTITQIARTIPALATQVASVSCTPAGVNGALTAIKTARETLQGLDALCRGGETSRTAADLARDIAGDAAAIRAQKAAQLAQMRDDVFEPCARKAETDFDLNLSDLRAKSDSYISANSSQDALTDEANRFANVVFQGNGTAAQIGLWGFVMALELLFFFSKYAYHKIFDGPATQTMLSAEPALRRTARVVKRYLVEDERSAKDFLLKSEQINCLGEDIQADVRGLMVHLESRKLAKRMPPIGYRVFQQGYLELTRLSEAPVEEPRPSPEKPVTAENGPLSAAEQVQPAGGAYGTSGGATEAVRPGPQRVGTRPARSEAQRPPAQSGPELGHTTPAAREAALTIGDDAVRDTDPPLAKRKQVKKRYLSNQPVVMLGSD